MSLPPLAADVLTIVIRGKFQPAVISPAWLREQELIGDAEFDEATFELLIPNQAVTFAARWIQCQVQPEMLQLQTSQDADFERLRDLAVGILTALPDLAISQLGINRNIHFSVKDYKAWHAVGDNLVHNEVWGDALHLSGMRNVLFWGVRPDNYGGRIQVQVEPSLPFPPGVFVAYNDHYDLTSTDSQPATRKEAEQGAVEESTEATVEKIQIATRILTGAWEPSMQRAKVVVERVADLTRNTNG